MGLLSYLVSETGARLAMRSVDGIFCDVDSWNLDGLAIEDPPQPYLPGRKRLIPLMPGLGGLKSAVLTDFGRLLLLYAEGDVIHSVDIDSGAHQARTPLHKVSNASDFVFSNGVTFVLDVGENSIAAIRGKADISTFPLGHELAPNARIVLDSTGTPPSFFIGPTMEGQILCVDSSLRRTCTPLTLMFEHGANLPVQPDAQFCVDHGNRARSSATLLVPDQASGRVIEADTTTGTVVRTFGDADRPDTTFPTVRFAEPVAVAMYRPEGFPLKHFLDTATGRSRQPFFLSKYFPPNRVGCCPRRVSRHQAGRNA
jgi:hypothetical protein